MQVDALVVGGGPIGLAVAVGLTTKGLNVRVIEKESEASLDWSSSYTYRVDARGIACLDGIGLKAKLVSLGVESRGFNSVKWRPDGQRTVRRSNASIGLGYWIQRPAFINLLAGTLPAGTVMTGTLQALEFKNVDTAAVVGQSVVATVECEGGVTKKIHAQLVFGCDGARSTVRQCLESLEPAFEQNTLKIQSSGLVYKAVLYDPPVELAPGRTYVVKGASGQQLTLLPFVGKPGQPRPLSFALPPEHSFNLFKSSEDVYETWQKEFPQLDVDQRLSAGSAAALCNALGSTFPKARWSSRAAIIAGNTGIALLGDSLHCFPPDLGQGVNAGLSDVLVLLKLWPCRRSLWSKCLEAYERLQVPESEAICKLLRVGMPYQYKLPSSFAKYAFFADFIMRVAASKLFPNVFSPAVVFMVTSDPPLQYSEILQRHEKNTYRLKIAASGMGAAVLVALAVGRWQSLRAHH